MSTWKPDRPPRSQVDPRPVAESLERMARRFGGAPLDVLGAVFAHWPDLVGDVVADHARPVSLRSGVLTVAVDQPAWATQLRLLSSSLMGRLSELDGGAGATGGAVVELRIVVEAPGSRRRP